MNTKRTMLVLAGLILLSGAVFAGGEQEAETAAVAEDGVSGEVVVSIKFKSWDEPGMQGLIAAYEKRNPNVEIVWEPKPSEGYPEWLGTALAAGNIRPDIVSGNYQGTYAHYVDFNKYRSRTNPYTGNRWEEDYGFDDQAPAVNTLGELIMLPTERIHTLWFYNEEIFDEVGVQPPSTWSDLIEVCEKLDAAGYVPIASNFQWKVNQWLPEIYFDQFHRDWHKIARAKPGDWCYDDDLDGNFEFDADDRFIETRYNLNTVRLWKGLRDGDISYDTPEVDAVIENFAAVFPQYANSDLFVTRDDYSMFLQQKVAMMTDGTWSIPWLMKDMENLNDLDEERRKKLKIEEGAALKTFDWGTFENPPMIHDLMDTELVRTVESHGGHYLSIVDKNQEQTELALDFTMFYLSAPGYQARVDAQVQSDAGYMASGPLLINGVQLPGPTTELFADIPTLGNAEIMINGFFATPGEHKPFMLDTLRAALVGEIPAAEFGRVYQEYIDENLEDILSEVGLTLDDLDHPERNPAE